MKIAKIINPNTVFTGDICLCRPIEDENVTFYQWLCSVQVWSDDDNAYIFQWTPFRTQELEFYTIT